MNKIATMGILFLLAAMIVAADRGAAIAASVYVRDDYTAGISLGGSPYFFAYQGTAQLIALGYTVTTGGPLADYSSYDQVWDLNSPSPYPTAAADLSSYQSYLASGGRMLLLGEHSGAGGAFGARNNILKDLVANVGGGTIGFVGDSPGTPGAFQTLTSDGQVVNAPNAFSSVFFRAGTVVTTTNGFLVTETASGSSQGTLVGWDFGDLSGALASRMLVSFDANILEPTNGIDWVENMATYLGAPVPEPEALGQILVGGFILLTVSLFNPLRRGVRQKERTLNLTADRSVRADT